MRIRTAPLVFSFLGLLASGATAQETAQTKTLNIEFNGMKTVENSCQMTFVISNSTNAEIEQSTFEFAFFDQDNLVQRLTALSFGKLKAGSTAVRQFAVPGGGCEIYSRILLNAIKSCTGPQGDLDICEASLTTANRTSIEFGE